MAIKRSVGGCLLLLFLLGTEISAQAADTRPELPLAALARECIQFAMIKLGPDKDLDARECRVTDFGAIGSVQGKTYYYALYCLVPHFAPGEERCVSPTLSVAYQQGGLALFVQEGSSGSAQLMLERANSEFGMFLYERPRIVRNSTGTMLYVPIELAGAGHGNMSEYFVLDQQRGWRQLDAQSWLKDLASRLPPGREIWKGVWPDLETMEATAGLYRPGDGNCCPSGGSARIELGIDGDRFVVKRLQLLP